MTTSENPMQKIITRCWEDEAFKKRLLADPAKILGEEGVSVPEGISIRVMADTDQVRTVIIPPAPSHLDDDQLIGITGGNSISCNRGLFFSVKDYDDISDSWKHAGEP